MNMNNRKRKERFSLFFLALFVIVCLVQWCRRNNYICFHGDAKKAIETFCKLYHKEIIGGNICQEVCGGTDGQQPIIADIQCYPYHHYTKLVVSVKWNETKEVILKLKEPEQQSAPNSAIGQLDKFVKYRVGMVPRGLKFRLYNYKEYLSGYIYEPAKSSWETALQTNKEFFLFSLFQMSDLTPDIMGYCGNLHAETKLNPIPYRHVMQWTTRNMWKIDLILAQKFLEMSDRLDYGVDGNKSLLFCDLKMEHFHFDNNSQLRVIDGSDIVFKDRHAESKHSRRICSSDSECNYLWCQGQCDKVTGRCEDYFLSDNLQLICEKVFLGRNRQLNMWIYRGILDTGMISLDLKDLVESCAQLRPDLNYTQRMARMKRIRQQLDMQIKIDLKKYDF